MTINLTNSIFTDKSQSPRALGRNPQWPDGKPVCVHCGGVGSYLSS